MSQATLLSSADVAEILGCSVSTVSRLASSGTLTPQRFGGGRNGGAMFFDPREVARVAAERAVERQAS